MAGVRSPPDWASPTPTVKVSYGARGPVREGLLWGKRASARRHGWAAVLRSVRRPSPKDAAARKMCRKRSFGRHEAAKHSSRLLSPTLQRMAVLVRDVPPRTVFRPLRYVLRASYLREWCKSHWGGTSHARFQRRASSSLQGQACARQTRVHAPHDACVV